MVYRFADFELDEQRRELRLRGRELRLQPRVFDVLAYLLRHRDRVVGKDELLDVLWPGMIVVDSALQRVVSLARTALREGNAESAIRTHARRGYRFCGDEVEESEGSGNMPPGEAVEALAHREWENAAAAFRSADEAAGLSADGLEQWAQALQFAGHGRDAVAPLERAVAAHAMAGNRRDAARAALWLAQIQFEQREFPVAEGWLRRGAGLLEHEAECREAGLLAWLSSRMALAVGERETALREAERAHALGKRLGDTGLETLGLLYRGHALMSGGEVRLGVRLHDEAAAAVLSGGVESWVGGIVYCGIIWGCRNRADWQRAAQWTDHFTRWCRDSGFNAYPGTCRLHRAEVLSVRGDLEEAEREVGAARKVLADCAPWAEGDACRLLGDLLQGRGDLESAGKAYRRAHLLGWDPNPGYARLLVATGRFDAAVRSLEDSLADPAWATRQRRGMLLAQLAIITARGGQPERARAALAELERQPQLWETPALKAHVVHARAEAAHAAGRARVAVTGLRQAIRLWREIGSPLNLAATHLRLAEWLAADADPDGADLELSAAETVLRTLGAPGLDARCATLRRAISRSLDSVSSEPVRHSATSRRDRTR